MNLAFSEYLSWTLLVIPAIILLFLVFNRSEKVILNWFKPSEVLLHTPVLKFGLRSLGFILLAVALIGPYWGRMEQKVNVLGREVYILLDVSGSMNAEDLKPTRLEKVKQELRKMVESLKGDKIGLIVFTSHAYVQCPLTTDYKAVKLFIDLLKTDQFANTGTDFRSGLGMTLDRFINIEKTMDKITRSIIIISDGEDFGDNYASILDRLKDNNIKVFPVGIGTLEGAPVPDMDYGKKIGYKTNKDGTPAVSRLKEEALVELAGEFGTQYHKIDEQIDDLRPVTEQIKLLSASVLNSKIEQVKNNRYQYFLALGLICFTLSMFWMPIRRKHP